MPPAPSSCLAATGCMAAGWLLAGWLLAPRGPPRIRITRPCGGNELVPRAHSYIQVAASRIQDTGYRILHPTRGYRIPETPCSTAKVQQGYRTHRMQDAGLIKPSTAWRPHALGIPWTWGIPGCSRFHGPESWTMTITAIFHDDGNVRSYSFPIPEFVWS